MRCKICGKSATEINGWLMRVNQIGVVPGEFECRPSCDVSLSDDDRLLAAIAGDDWQGIETAPHDGTLMLVRAKNASGVWMDPVPARYVENTAVPDPLLSHFWSAVNDDRGNPVALYYQPEEWKQL